MSQPISFLLVEDNDDHAELVRQSFDTRRLANKLFHVGSGEDALAFLKRDGRYADAERPDVVLLDLNLPGMNGLDVLKFIKQDEALHTIPVVVLTTSNAEVDRIRAYREHVNSYVTKPVDFERMQDIVQQLELYWTICNRPPQ